MPQRHSLSDTQALGLSTTSDSLEMSIPRSASMTSNSQAGVSAEICALIYDLDHLLYTHASKYPRLAIQGDALVDILVELKNAIVREASNPKALWRVKATAKERVQARLEKVEKDRNIRKIKKAEENLGIALKQYTKAMESINEETTSHGLGQREASEKRNAANETWEKALKEFEKVRKAVSMVDP